MSLSLISSSILICPELRLRHSPSPLSRPFALSSRSNQFSIHQFSQIPRSTKVTARDAMETTAETISGGVPNNTMKLLFVEMGVGYDQHGYVQISQFFSTLKFRVLIDHIDVRFESWNNRNRQDVTSAAMKACKNAISSNSIPAFRRGTKTDIYILTLGSTMEVIL